MFRYKRIKFKNKIFAKSATLLEATLNNYLHFIAKYFKEMPNLRDS